MTCAATPVPPWSQPRHSCGAPGWTCRNRWRDAALFATLSAASAGTLHAASGRCSGPRVRFAGLACRRPHREAAGTIHAVTLTSSGSAASTCTSARRCGASASVAVARPPATPAAAPAATGRRGPAIVRDARASAGRRRSAQRRGRSARHECGVVIHGRRSSCASAARTSSGTYSPEGACSRCASGR